MIRVLAFDLDDTLYPERQFVLGGFAAVDRWLAGKQLAAPDRFATAATTLFEAGRRGRIFDDALRELDIPPAPALIAQMVEVYRLHRPVLRLFDDAAAALAAFRRHYRLAVITDGFLATQRSKIEALGLDTATDLVVCTDEAGRAGWKPSPRGYLRVMEHFACTGPECLYAGDNPAKDFVTARQLGWHTVRIRRPGGEHTHAHPAPDHEAHCELPSLDGLDAVVARVSAS